MVTPITPNVHEVVCILLVELLNGQLSDQTIDAVRRIERKDVPEPLSDVIGYIHGMSKLPQLRDDIISDLLIELGAGCEQLGWQRKHSASAIS